MHGGEYFPGDFPPKHLLQLLTNKDVFIVIVAVGEKGFSIFLFSSYSTCTVGGLRMFFTTLLHSTVYIIFYYFVA